MSDLWARCGASVAAAAGLVNARWNAWVHDPGTAYWEYARALEDVTASLAPSVRFRLRVASPRVPLDHRAIELCEVDFAPGCLNVAVHRDLFVPGVVPFAIAYRLVATLVVLATAARDAPRASAPFTLCLGDEGTGYEAGFCAAEGDCLLIPDPDFLMSAGYRTFRDLVGQHWIEWQDRAPTLFWRGSTTGKPRPEAVRDDALGTLALLPRLEMCWRLLRSSRAASCNVGISAVVQLTDSALIARVERELVRERVERIDQLGFRYFVDIDGNTNAWSGLMQALLMGGCVLKVGSPHQFRQWYYDRLSSWETHVPVAADLSDLDEAVGWALDHPEEARAIADRGRRLAGSIDFDEAVAEGGRALLDRFASARQV